MGDDMNGGAADVKRERLQALIDGSGRASQMKIELAGIGDVPDFYKIVIVKKEVPRRRIGRILDFQCIGLSQMHFNTIVELMIDANIDGYLSGIDYGCSTMRGIYA